MSDYEDFGVKPPFRVGLTNKGRHVLVDSERNVLAIFPSEVKLELAQRIAKALTHDWKNIRFLGKRGGPG